MGGKMFMSLGSTDHSEGAVALSTSPQPTQPAWYLRGRWLFAIWVLFSALWVMAVGYELFERVSTQADMSRDVENDLNQGFVTASCVGTSCNSEAGNVAISVSPSQNWMGIASTYLRFGSDEMAETVLGPPAALLVIGLGGAFLIRRRLAKTEPDRT
jgi:MYXO-CTERM domain-containing protein